jgi:tetratricopeptide (TPR) repeat protein
MSILYGMKKRIQWVNSSVTTWLIALAITMFGGAQAVRAQESSGDYWDKADAESEDGKYEQAAEDYSRGLKLDPDHFAIWGHLGDCYVKLRRYEDAVAAYNKQLGVAGTDTIAYQAYENLGDVYFEMKQYQRALDAYTRAIGLQPDDSDAYAGRAEVYKALGQSAKAEEDQQKADQLNAKGN